MVKRLVCDQTTHVIAIVLPARVTPSLLNRIGAWFALFGALLVFTLYLLLPLLFFFHTVSSVMLRLSLGVGIFTVCECMISCILIQTSRLTKTHKRSSPLTAFIAESPEERKCPDIALLQTQRMEIPMR
jgi:hypothetical protein